MSFFDELKRRKNFRVAAAYVVTSWLFVLLFGLDTESVEAMGAGASK